MFPVSPQDVDNDLHDQAARGLGAGQADDRIASPEDDADEEIEEAVAAKRPHDPQSPSKAEWLSHQATHLPFRSWCPECVAGRSDNPGHRKRAAEERTVPEISIDYAFIRREAETDTATILVVKDRASRAVQATVLRMKGASLEEAGEKATEAVANFGHTAGKLMVKCDNENAMLDLRAEVIRRLPVGVLAVNSPVGESQSNGVVENGVKVYKGLLRVHLASLEKKLKGAKIPSSHPILTWMVEYVGDVLTKYLRGNDGKTGYQRLYGKSSNEEEYEFGERVMFRPKPRKDMNVILDGRWLPGVWLGRNWGSITHRIAVDSNLVVESRAVRRVPLEERWSIDNVQHLLSTTWNWTPPEDGVSDYAVIEAPGPVEVVDRTRAYNPRAVYLRPDDFAKHGYTSNCRRCKLMREGRSVKGTLHVPKCRERLEARLREDGDTRVDIAKTRVDGHIADRMRQQIAAEEEEAAATPVARHTGPEAATRVYPRSNGFCTPALKRQRKSPAELEAQAVRFAQAAAEIPADDDGPPPLTAEEDDDSDDDNGADPVELEEDSDDDDAMLNNLMTGSARIRAMPKTLATEFTQLYELFLLHGVSPCLAQHKVTELFSPPRVNLQLRSMPHLGLDCGTTFDLERDAQGVQWNFLRADDRARCRKQIAEEKPFVVIGSPPCTMFSSLQIFNGKFMASTDGKRRLAEAHVLLNFAIDIYFMQLSGGRHFLHEHPAGARSWTTEKMAELMGDPRVGSTTTHMCQFGMTTTGKDGSVKPVRKATKFASSSPLILDEISRRCDGSHDHQRLVDGRARCAQVYPPALCAAMLRGIDRQRIREGTTLPENLAAKLDNGCAIYALHGTRDERIDLADDAQEEELQHESDALAAHREAAWNWSQSRPSGTIVRDNLTGEVLPSALVAEARAEEIQFMEQWEVWEEVSTEECLAKTGKRPIGGRWVDINKGDPSNPLIRCRYVAQEVAHFKDDDFFAAMPPLEALRMLISEAATNRKPGQQGKKLLVIDARKAHLHATAVRELFVELPPEIRKPGRCGRLKRCLYGTRDAPALWEAYLASELVKHGFVRGAASSCVFRHALRDLQCVVHGDDFTFCGCEADLQWATQQMETSFMIKIVGRLGPDAHDLQEIRILNRILRWTATGITYEADPRHAELLARDLDSSGPSVTTAGVKIAKEEEKEKPLVGMAIRQFRSGAARANYLAQDRADVSFAAKELCRQMSEPTETAWAALLRIVRYLRNEPRMIYRYKWQKDSALSVYVDTDFAGCTKTRKSTSGGCAFRGTHMVKHWSSTQRVVTLSSAEAELTGIVKGSTEGLGLRSLAEDFGWTAQLKVFTDSSAAMGICKRTGIGKVRHLATGQLWIQDRIRTKDIELYKVAGNDNPADMLTKHLARETLDKHLHFAGMERHAGRAETAPAINNLG